MAESPGSTTASGHIAREGRSTEAARRQPDGRWLFVIDNPSVPED